MTSCRGELHPAEFFVGPFRAALPRIAGKVRKFVKGFYLFRIFVVFAPTVLPLVGRRFGCGRWSVFRRGVDEIEGFGDFEFGRRALVNFFVEIAHALFGQSFFVEAGEGASAFGNKWTVEEEKRLLRNGGCVALADVNIRIGKIKHAEGGG